MNFLIFFGLVIIIIAMKQDQKTQNNHKNIDLDNLYEKHGEEKGLDPRLLRAIAIVESSENPSAINPADPSFGLMQILFRQNSDGTVNKLNVKGWPPNYQTELFDPDYNLHIGAQILAWNIQNFGLKRGVATYNSWEARKSEKSGPFPNQEYVDKVMKNYNELCQLKNC